MQLQREWRHLLLECLSIVPSRLGADVTAGRKHVPVLPNAVKFCSHAEAGLVNVLACVLVAAPGVVGSGNLGEVFGGQPPMYPIRHRPELSRVEKQRLACPAPEPRISLVSSQ